LVCPGANGWLVPAGDVDALVKAMQSCLDMSDAKLAAMGAAARESAFSRHRADVAASKLGRLFKTVGGARGSIAPRAAQAGRPPQSLS
jgi:glycosyltransferase involved in cell wall biosynthesis